MEKEDKRPPTIKLPPFPNVDYSTTVSPRHLLQALSEYGACLVTGATENLMVMPAAADPTDILPSGAVCVAEGVVSPYSAVMSVATIIAGYRVKLRTYPELLDYNFGVLSTVLSEDGEFKDDEPSGFQPDSAEQWSKKEWTHISLWEHLAQLHIKGIETITKLDNGVELQKIDLQNLCIRFATTRRKSAPSIIRSV